MLDGNFNTTVEKDFFALMTGECLGWGQFRKVYVLATDPRWVIKFETGAQSFSNIVEWNLWNDAQHMHEDVRKWLAPCRMISPCGSILIQRRTTKATTFPDKVPAWMTDIKKSNFGMIGRQFVAHDYGNNLVANAGLTRRLRKADWDE